MKFMDGFEKVAISNDFAHKLQAGGILSRLGVKNTPEARKQIMNALADAEETKKTRLRINPSGYKGVDYESFVRDYMGPTGVRKRGVKLRDWRPRERGIHPTDLAKQWAKTMPKNNPLAAAKFLKKLISK